MRIEVGVDSSGKPSPPWNRLFCSTARTTSWLVHVVDLGLPDPPTDQFPIAGVASEGRLEVNLHDFQRDRIHSDAPI